VRSLRADERFNVLQWSSSEGINGQPSAGAEVAYPGLLNGKGISLLLGTDADVGDGSLHSQSVSRAYMPTIEHFRVALG